MKKHSILIINRVHPPHKGATGRMASNLADNLAHIRKNNHKLYDVRVLTTRGKKENEPNRAYDVQSVQANQNPTRMHHYMLIWVKLYWAAMRMPKHDIIITLTDPPMSVMMGRFLSLFKRAKHIHWSHDVYPDLLPHLKPKFKKGWFYRFLIKQSRKAMNKAHKVVTLEKCMASFLSKTGVSLDKIATITNWADPKIFKAHQGEHVKSIEVQTAKPITEMFRDDSPKFRVLYAGNIGLAHDADIILEAAKILAPHNEIEIVFVGTSNAHEALSEKRSKEGLDNVKFITYQPDHKLKEILESGDLHLVMMNQGTSGMLVPCKFYAAIATARPVLFVGPKSCALSSLITESGAGKHIRIKDRQAAIKELAEVILHYRHNGDEWFAAQKGAIDLSTRYNPSASLNQWIDLIEKVAKS